MSQAGPGGTMLVAGASGVVGAAAVEHFARLAEWRVIGLSRRPPDPAPTGFEHLGLDLTDPDACAAAAEGLAGVTHVVYAALFEKPGLMPGWLEADQMRTNLAMMRNLMDPLARRARCLRHVSVLQGTKAYGAHLHRLKVPARERAPRDPHANFYWLQEDYIRAAARDAGWSFTIWRPQVVFGGALGVAMNLVPVIGAYGAICRELGLPFLCPGEHDHVIEAVDADLVARALAWAAQSQAARGETFNITNGDVFVWENVWPAIAAALGLEPAFGRAVQLSRFLPEHAPAWERIVARHGLRPIPMAELLGQSHHYADLLFGWGARGPLPATLVSTIKLRQAGFGDCIDTEAMFAKWFARLAERKVLPQARPER
ncbi:MAG TPA: SDR family oxidoreductase [Caulobacteraceae bacterium]|nr:SDR family oxidoreductase [Caulobacteraceae bacterium]